MRRGTQALDDALFEVSDGRHRTLGLVMLAELIVWIQSTQPDFFVNDRVCPSSVRMTVSSGVRINDINDTPKTAGIATFDTPHP